MHKYWIIFSLALQDTLQYRFDTFFKGARYGIGVFLIAIFWLAIARETPSAGIDPNAIITYYALAAVIYGISNFHTDYVEEDIRQGYISKYLVKPVSPFVYYFAHQSTHALFETVFKTLIVIPTLLLLGYHLPTTLAQILLATAFLPVIFYTLFTLYFTVSTTAFWFINVDSLRMSVMFVFRFLSGIFIPLNFLPESYLRWSVVLPFQHMAFTPIQLIRGELAVDTGLQYFGILCVWLVVFTAGRLWVWHRAIHSFDSTGL